MRRHVLIAGLLAVLSLSVFPTQADEIGLGFILGEPTGVNAQFFWTPNTSIDFTLAWSVDDWLYLGADYQVYNYIGDAPYNWKWFYGFGGYVGIVDDNDRGRPFGDDDDVGLGVRVPLGIRYRIPDSVVDIWGEIAPGILLLPDTDAELQGGLGVTFWVK